MSEYHPAPLEQKQNILPDAQAALIPVLLIMGHLQPSNHVVPNWRANDALGHVEQRKLKFGGPVCHLLSSLAILYRVIAQLQRANYLILVLIIL